MDDLGGSLALENACLAVAGELFSPAPGDGPRAAVQGQGKPTTSAVAKWLSSGDSN